jgi:hypothetical protein
MVGEGRYPIDKHRGADYLAIQRCVRQRGDTAMLGCTDTQQSEIAGIMGDDDRVAARGIPELIGIARTDHSAFECGIRIETAQPEPYSETNVDALIEVDKRLRRYQSSEINAASFSAM